MSRLVVLMLAIVAFGLGCKPDQPPSRQPPEPITFEPVELQYLIAFPERYDGRPVLIRGHLIDIAEDTDSRLWATARNCRFADALQACRGPLRGRVFGRPPETASCLVAWQISSHRRKMALCCEGKRREYSRTAS